VQIVDDMDGETGLIFFLKEVNHFQLLRYGEGEKETRHNLAWDKTFVVSPK